jgi:hypothetical protein
MPHGTKIGKIMARSRNIKPNFFKNYDLADLGMASQLLFAGLWCLADKEGRLEDKPRLIKAEIFPYYDIDVNGELTKLERLSFVERYEVDGVKVLSIPNFKKHQSPHHTEKDSTLPKKPENYCKIIHLVSNGELTVKPQEQDGENPPDSLIPDSLNIDSLIPDLLIAETPKKQKKDTPATRLPNDWVLPNEYLEYCLTKRPDLNPDDVAEVFKNYWVAKAGSDAKKLDWYATWCNWVLRQEKSKGNFYEDKQNQLKEFNKNNNIRLKMKLFGTTEKEVCDAS